MEESLDNNSTMENSITIRRQRREKIELLDDSSDDDCEAEYSRRQRTETDTASVPKELQTFCNEGTYWNQPNQPRRNDNYQNLPNKSPSKRKMENQQGTNSKRLKMKDDGAQKRVVYASI
jgi:hypothetical protein